MWQMQCTHTEMKPGCKGIWLVTVCPRCDQCRMLSSGGALCREDRHVGTNTTSGQTSWNKSS